MKYVIIGGVAGGAGAAARLRRLDEQAEIIMLEKGEFISFANCGLPYYLSGVISEKEKLLVQTPASFTGRFNVDVRIFSEAIAIDSANKTVVTLMKIITTLRDRQDDDEPDPLLEILSGRGTRAGDSRIKIDENI